MQHNFVVVVVDWCHTKTDLQVNVVCRSVQYLEPEKLLSSNWRQIYSSTVFCFPSHFRDRKLESFWADENKFLSAALTWPRFVHPTADITANTPSVCTVDWWEVAWLALWVPTSIFPRFFPPFFTGSPPPTHPPTPSQGQLRLHNWPLSWVARIKISSVQLFLKSEPFYSPWF